MIRLLLATISIVIERSRSYMPFTRVMVMFICAMIRAFFSASVPVEPAKIFPYSALHDNARRYFLSFLSFVANAELTDVVGVLSFRLDSMVEHMKSELLSSPSREYTM